MAKNELGALLRGLGTGVKVIQKIADATVRHGGEEWMLELLTRPRFEGNLDAIGKTIAACDWRIPASEMRTRAAAHFKKTSKTRLWRHEYGFAFLERIAMQAENLWWIEACQDLGIPVHAYSDNPDDGLPGVPFYLRRQLEGKLMEYPLFCLDKQARKHVVVDWEIRPMFFIDPGEAIGKFETVLAIADARHFDFDK